jgi:MFS family permease
MKSRSFLFLWLSQSLANLGDVFYTVALVTLVYKVTQNVTFTALVPFFVYTAQLISGLLAPLLLDRMPLQRILLYFQLGKSLILILLCLLTASAVATQHFALLFLFIFLTSFLDGWTTPARNALVPRLVSEKHLIKANSMLATTDQTVQFIGWASGGLLVAALGSVHVLWSTLVLFLFATVLTLPIRDRTKCHREKNEPGSKLDSIRVGWLTIWQTPPLRVILFMDVLEGIAEAVWMGAILLAFVQEALQLKEQWWGFINASYLVGTIAGSLIVLLFSKWINRRLTMALLISSTCYGMFILIFGMSQSPWGALLCSLLMGPVYQMRDIAQRTISQQNVSLELLPKVLSAQNTLNYATYMISILLMGLIAETLGVRAVYLTASGLLGLASLIGALLIKTLMPRDQTSP